MINKWLKLEEYQVTWKLLLLITVVMNILTLFDYISEDTINLGFIISGMVIISLYGLAYETAIWSKKIWKFIFWFLILLTSIFVLLLLISSPSIIQKQNNITNNPFTYIFGLAFLIYSFLQIRAVYLYSYKRNHIWEK